MYGEKMCSGYDVPKNQETVACVEKTVADKLGLLHEIISKTMEMSMILEDRITGNQQVQPQEKPSAPNCLTGRIDILIGKAETIADTLQIALRVLG